MKRYILASLVMFSLISITTQAQTMTRQEKITLLREFRYEMREQFIKENGREPTKYETRIRMKVAIDKLKELGEIK